MKKSEDVKNQLIFLRRVQCQAQKLYAEREDLMKIVITSNYDRDQPTKASLEARAKIDIIDKKLKSMGFETGLEKLLREMAERNKASNENINSQNTWKNGVISTWKNGVLRK